MVSLVEHFFGGLKKPPGYRSALAVHAEGSRHAALVTTDTATIEGLVLAALFQGPLGDLAFDGNLMGVRSEVHGRLPFDAALAASSSGLHGENVAPEPMVDKN
jgi:hypothetical protein